MIKNVIKKANAWVSKIMQQCIGWYLIRSIIILKTLARYSTNRKNSWQMDSLLPRVCGVTDHRWSENVVKTKSGTLDTAEYVNDVRNTFWRLLWFVTVQTWGGVESIYLKW